MIYEGRSNINGIFLICNFLNIIYKNYTNVFVLGFFNIYTLSSVFWEFFYSCTIKGTRMCINHTAQNFFHIFIWRKSSSCECFFALSGARFSSFKEVQTSIRPKMLSSDYKEDVRIDRCWSLKFFCCIWRLMSYVVPENIGIGMEVFRIGVLFYSSPKCIQINVN